MAAGSPVLRPTNRTHPRATSAASNWNATRSAVGDAPASLVVTAAIAMNPGPYTAGWWRQRRETWLSSGSGPTWSGAKR